MIEGQIALAARGYLPETWDALASSTFFGEPLLESKGKFVKFLLFGTVIDTAQEAVLYNPLVLEYAAKGLAISVIPGAADYYANQIQTVTSTGTNETRSYPDRIASLWRIHARLLIEMTEMKDRINEYVPTSDTRVLQFLPSNTGADLDYLSIDPHCFPHGSNHRNRDLSWSSWQDSSV